MKKSISIILLGIVVAAVAGVSPLKWKATSLNIGTVNANEAVALSFEFTNTTSEAVQIIEAKGSCGCTNVAFPQRTIAPGESAAVTAQFKSGKPGVFKKNIRIKTSDSDEYTYLYFTGEVVE